MDTTIAELEPLSDEEVLARVVGGEAAAFEALMRRHNQRLFRAARSVVRDDLEAEDVVQETYVRAYAHLSRFEGRSSVATWLTRIAFHEALRRKRQRLRADTAARSLVDSQSPRIHEPEESEMVDLGNTRSVLTQALDSLPENLRTVVVLRIVQGLSTRETAECLRLSEVNVKVLLHRGRKALREQLDSQQFASFSEEYAFGAERCDRVVEAVFRRLDIPSAEYRDARAR